MFLNRDTTGGDGLIKSSQSVTPSTPAQKKSPILSHTGDIEEKTVIQPSGGVVRLIGDNTTLVTAIIEK